jgi:hypothetical protein
LQLLERLLRRSQLRPAQGGFACAEAQAHLRAAGSCPTCHLVLDSYELIEQAGLPATFEVIDDNPPPEPDYGND